MPRTPLLVLLVAALVSCTPSRHDDPVARMLDRNAVPKQRLAAAEQAALQEPESDRYLAALNRLVWDRGHPSELRRFAIDQLVARDAAKFKQDLQRRIVLVQDWTTLEHIFDVAVERQWTDINPTLVRQYARPVRGMTEEQRPERKVIAALNPGKSVERVVFEVFAGDDTATPVQQAAAWQLLARITPPQELMDFLRSAQGRGPVFDDLQAGARDLGVVPRTAQQVAWLQTLRGPDHAAWWQRVTQKVANLSHAQRQRLALRHLPVLDHLDQAILSANRDELFRRVAMRIDSSDHYLVGPQYDGPMRDYPQRFTHYADELSWGDLATILTLYRALDSPTVVAVVFQQADQDQQDQSTEYGGILGFTDGGFGVRPYQPAFRQHDHKFIAPQAMITDLYTDLAHYHFHAHRTRNASYAGPGIGDLEFARRMGFNCVVFTFIRPDLMNADYCREDGVVVDLGVITRP